MRHRKSGRHFNMPGAHRDSMLRNLAVSLIEHELIKTTLPRAKELRRVAEPLITMAKEDSLAFNELGPRYQGRPGGYTRILKCGYRHGDNAPMAYIELVDRPVAVEDASDDKADDSQD